MSTMTNPTIAGPPCRARRRQPRGRRGRLSKAALALALIATTIVTTASTAVAAPVFFCDANSDGISDLPTGSPNEDIGPNDGSADVDVGIFDIYMGDPGGLTDPNPDFALVGTAPGVQLGQVTLCIDLNGDTFQDLVLGIPFGDVGDIANAGVVMYYPGSESGLLIDQARTIHQDSPGIKERAEPGDVFGSELTWGDFDNDGIFDLVVSAPGEDIGSASNAGKVHVFFGDENGPSARDLILSQNSPGIKDRAQANDEFGVSLASQDFDGDGNYDLAIGVPKEDVNGHVNAGAINVIYGNGTTLTRRDQFIHQDRKNVSGAAEDFDHFGAPLLVSDMIGPFDNRRWDLFVGVPAEDIGSRENAGSVYLLTGTPRGLRGDVGEVWHRDKPGIKDTAGAGDEFGTSLMVGFFDGDSSLDLAVGVPGDDGGGRNSGSIHILYGDRIDGAGLSASDTILHQDTDGIPGRRQAGDRLGMTQAGGDFNGDGFYDLAVGIPLEDVDGATDAGAFLVMYGSVGGLTSAGAQMFTQDFDVIGSDPEPGDNFGIFNTPLTCCGGLNVSSAGATFTGAPLDAPRRPAIPDGVR